MPKPSPDELWSLLVRTSLIDEATAAALRAEHDARPGGSVADARGITAWLVERGTITRWQAKRLAIGDAGPFILGDYRLLERHDHDGEALRFSAVHQPSGQPVSVVLLHGKRCRDATHWQELVRAAGAATAVTDPLVSRTWALELVGNSRLVVCEDVGGEPLADELARTGPLPLAEAGAVALRIATALGAIHAAGRVHGALSLDTLVREPAPAAGDGLRLLQFPLAGDPHLLPPRVPAATAEDVARLGRRASFVAPELLAPGAVCDMRSDVYALGCVLQSLVTGAAPCARHDAAATLAEAVAAGPPALGPPAFPAELGALVGYLTARDPAGRYPHAVEAAAAIATCFGLPVPRLAAPPAAAPVAPEPVAAWGGLEEPPELHGGAPVGVPTGADALDGAVVKTSASARIAALQATRRRARTFRTIGGVAVGAVAAVVAVVLVSQYAGREERAPTSAVKPPVKADAVARGPEKPAVQPAPATPAPVPEQPVAPADPGVQTVSAALPARPAVTIVDDPTLPRESPTVGPPPDLAYLPAGSQLFLVARLAEIDGDEEGRLFLRSLGPAAAEAVAWLAAACGCGPGDIETVQAGWQAGETDEIEGGCMARLVGQRTVPDDAAFRGRAWGATTPREVAGETIHVGKTMSYWMPKAEGKRVLVVAPEARLVQVVTDAAEGRAEVMLPTDLERLHEMLDGTRHVTVFGSPHYLLNRGRKVFVGPLASLPGPVESLLGEGAQAAALSIHFGADFYAELDVVATLDTPPTQLAAQLQERVAGLPDAVEAHCAALNAHPYGRRLIIRFPAMLRALAGQTRAAAENKGVVVNAYLPRHAGHNLALATELALSQAPGGGGGAVAANAPAAAAPQDALGKLGKKITLTFAKDDLERVIQMVSDEVGVPMEIVGPDLQLEGITKNQPLGLDERDKPAVEILKVILKKADPVGRLVYYVKKKDGVESIEISTRVAAEKRGEKLAPGQ